MSHKTDYANAKNQKSAVGNAFLRSVIAGLKINYASAKIQAAKPCLPSKEGGPKPSLRGFGGRFLT